MGLSWSLSRFAGVAIGARPPRAHGPVIDAARPRRPLFPVLEVRLTEHGPRIAGPEAWEWGRRIPRPGADDDDGVFAGWRCEGGSVSAWVDRLGLAPLFYAATPGSILLSPNPLWLARRLESPEIDDDAMAVFVRRGYFVGCDTPWKAVRAMPPGGRLAWRGGVLEVSGRIPIVPETRLSYDAAVDAYIDVFRAAVAARPPGDHAVLPLSGGRDSRHILLELCRQGVKPRAALTVRRFEPEPGDEVSVASGLAESVGVEHRVAGYERSWTAYELEKNRRTGFCTDEHNHMMVFARAAEGSFDVAYDGILGDVLSAPFVPGPEHGRMVTLGRFEELAREILDPVPGTRGYELWKPVVSEQACGWLLSPAQQRRWSLERAVARVAAELRLHAHAVNPLDSFHVFNRTRREVALAPFAVVRGVPTFHAPFADRDVFDLLSSLPAPGLIQVDFHDHAINRAYPRFADVPYAVGRGRFATSAADNLRWLARLAAFTATGAPGGPARGSASGLARVARYVAHHARGGPRARCGRAMVVYLNQLLAEGA